MSNSTETTKEKEILRGKKLDTLMDDFNIHLDEYAKAYQKRNPPPDFYGKGLMATESVVSMVLEKQAATKAILKEAQRLAGMNMAQTENINIDDIDDSYDCPKCGKKMSWEEFKGHAQAGCELGTKIAVTSKYPNDRILAEYIVPPGDTLQTPFGLFTNQGTKPRRFTISQRE